jgi:hypothetical protein
MSKHVMKIGPAVLLLCWMWIMERGDGLLVAWLGGSFAGKRRGTVNGTNDWSFVAALPK